jgi:autotransporter-associated beta strand protein
MNPDENSNYPISNPNPTFPMFPTSPIIISKVSLLLVATAFSANIALGETVTYTMQTGFFNSLQTERNNEPPFAGIFNNGATEVGIYANGGSLGNTPGAAAFQTFTTTGNGTSGSARALQVGDTFTITAFTSANPSAGGYLGISFRDSTTYTDFFSSTDNTTEARFQLDNTGGWKVYNSGPARDSGLGSDADRTFVIKITSSTTFDAQIGGTWFYNNTMAASGGAIDSFALYSFGDSNQNSFWKDASLTDTGTVELGYALAGAGTFTPGVIADGLAANSTSTVRVNDIFIGGDAGSQVNLAQANTYTGTTTVNTNAAVEAQHANAFGGTDAGTTVTSGGALKLFSESGISFAAEALTLDGTGVSGANGALRNVGGNNTWTGAVTLAGNTRINADNSGGNGSLTISGGITGGANALFVGAREAANIALSGSITGSGASLSEHGNATTSLFKDGGAALTLSGSSSFTGATLLSNGTILVGNNNAFGTGFVQIHWNTPVNTKTLASTDGTARTLSNTLNIFNDVTLGAADRTGSLNFTGPVALGDTVGIEPSGINRFITTATSTSHSFGNLSGNRSLIKRGEGTLNLNGTTNTATGLLVIDNGTVNLGGGNVAFASIDIGSGVAGDEAPNNATLRVTGITAAYTSPIVVNAEGAAGTRTIDFANTSGTSTLSGSVTLEKEVAMTVASGGTASITGAVSGVHLITKSGAGTLRFNNTVAGPVTVTAGTLGGNTTISGLVTLNSGATLAPGNSIGTMNFNAGLTLDSSSTVRMEISNISGSADRINVSGGQLTYAGNLVFDAASMAGVTDNTYTLFNTTGATTTGSWSSVALASGGSPAFTNDGGIWTRNAGDGNVWTYNQSLGTLTVVPEPSTYALMGVGAAFVLWRIRRRKRD